MCAPTLIKFGPKYYKMEDMLFHIFFNALSDEDAQRFFREFEVDENGKRIPRGSLPPDPPPAEPIVEESL